MNRSLYWFGRRSRRRQAGVGRTAGRARGLIGMFDVRSGHASPHQRTGTRMAPALNPIDYSTELEAAGVSRQQAAVHARALGTVLDDVAFTHDFSKLEGNLRKEIQHSEEKVTARIESARTDLSARIDIVRTELEAKIASVRTGLDAKVEWVRAELEAKIEFARIGRQVQGNQCRHRASQDGKQFTLCAIGCALCPGPCKVLRIKQRNDRASPAAWPAGRHVCHSPWLDDSGADPMSK
jgi:hypothetical protein